MDEVPLTEEPPSVQGEEVNSSGDRWDSDINCGVLHGLLYGARVLLPLMVADTDAGRAGVFKLSSILSDFRGDA